MIILILEKYIICMHNIHKNTQEILDELDEKKNYYTKKFKIYVIILKKLVLRKNFQNY